MKGVRLKHGVNIYSNLLISSKSYQFHCIRNLSRSYLLICYLPKEVGWLEQDVFRDQLSDRAKIL